MLFNTQTLQRVSEYEFRNLFPSTSFPAVLTDAIVSDFGHAVLVYPTQPTAAANERVVDVGQTNIGGTWTVTWEVVPETPQEAAERAAQVQALVTAQVQERLDAFARTRNYDGMLSACTYAGSAVQKFADEGAYCKTARDSTWAALYTILAEVEAETRPMPSDITDIEADLPSLAWPA